MAENQIHNIEIPGLELRDAVWADVPILRDMAVTLRKSVDADYFERNFEFADKGEREILIARANGIDAGYCILNWQPKYGFFKKLDIPEIQDLNVLPALRKQGIATCLIMECEKRARAKGFDHMGIGVGMDVSFGPAQRLYVKMGYIPDGNGLTYDRRPVNAGEFRIVDQNLCLMMVKAL
jgi:GNAT superfamily N-acetyltransferase